MFRTVVTRFWERYKDKRLRHVNRTEP
jgi:hypothetical protein